MDYLSVSVMWRSYTFSLKCTYPPIFLNVFHIPSSRDIYTYNTSFPPVLFFSRSPHVCFHVIFPLLPSSVGNLWKKHFCEIYIGKCWKRRAPRVWVKSNYQKSQTLKKKLQASAKCINLIEKIMIITFYRRSYFFW